MATARRHFSAEFKSKLAIEAIKGLQTINEIAGQYGVHPNQITSWKKQLLSSAPDLFSDKRAKENLDGQNLTNRLYQEIGQLKVELDWLKKKSGLVP